MVTTAITPTAVYGHKRWVRPLIATVLQQISLFAPASLSPGQAQKSRAASGSVVADQNSVVWPSRLWVTFATGTSIDLPPRVAAVSKTNFAWRILRDIGVRLTQPGG